MLQRRKLVVILANAASKLYDHGYGMEIMAAVDKVLLEEGFDKDHPHRKSVKSAVCGELGIRGNIVKKKLKRRKAAKIFQRSFNFRRGLAI